jgi:N-methylhydantoinase A/oxoprolinase/acetone carboxylase beta subunit
MRSGSHGRGPAVIEEYDSTLVVNPGWSWSLREHGSELSR